MNDVCIYMYKNLKYIYIQYIIIYNNVRQVFVCVATMYIYFSNNIFYLSAIKLFSYPFLIFDLERAYE